MSSQNLTAQIDWLQSVKLIFNEYHEVNKRFKGMCLQKNSILLKALKKKSIADVGYQFKVPSVPKKKRKILINTDAKKIKKNKGRTVTDIEKDLIVSSHIRKHLLKQSLLSQNVKYILSSNACDMTKDIFRLAQKNTKLFPQYASKLDFIISQQNLIVRHAMRSCAKKLSAQMVNLRLKGKLRFVGHLGYHQVINPTFFKTCLNVCLVNKTEIHTQCFLKLVKGYGDTWTTKMPSDIVEKFINIVNENNYSKHTQNKLKKYYSKYIQVNKKG
ncbi:hypothetical protein HCN44_007970 [Aphidius gifuensis]|uniref:Uncharacterized protein n=1 Tax=Aphidius gifuensis TaxID=684658 RepID=A0A834XR12_APHGI|nr:hypothetical protein HCN44_007970 [Aphidius gifuensis]